MDSKQLKIAKNLSKIKIIPKDEVYYETLDFLNGCIMYVQNKRATRPHTTNLDVIKLLNDTLSRINL